MCCRQRFKRPPLSFTAARSLAPMAPTIDLDLQFSLGTLEQSDQWSSIARTKKMLSKPTTQRDKPVWTVLTCCNRRYASGSKNKWWWCAQKKLRDKQACRQRHCLQLVEEERENCEKNNRHENSKRHERGKSVVSYCLSCLMLCACFQMSRCGWWWYGG